MEPTNPTSQRKPKHDDPSYYYTDLDNIANRQPLPTYEMHTAPRISSDILEVTNNKGAVGFVAIGRVRSYQNSNSSPHYHTAPNLPRSAEQCNRRSESYYEDHQHPRIYQLPNHVNFSTDNNRPSMHSRHHSEPTLIDERDYTPTNRSPSNRLNRRNEIFESPSPRTTNVAAEQSNRRVKKSKKNRHSKSYSQTENEKKEQGK